MSDQIETPALDAPIAPATPEAPVAPVNLSDDALVRLQVDGKDLDMPWKDARSQMMLHSSYTQKTQALARERAELENQRTSFGSERDQLLGQVQQLQTILRDPAKLSMLHMALTAQQQQQNPQAPPQSQAVTFDQLNAFRQQILQEAKQTLDGSWREREQAAQAKHLETELDNAVKPLIADHPILSKLPGVADLIYGEVEKMRPVDFNQARQYMATVVEGMKESLGQATVNAGKQAAITSTKLANALEPAGGQAMPPTAKKYKGLDDPQMRTDVEAFFKQSLGL